MGTLDAPGTGIEPTLSLVIPVRDEQPNVAPLLSELREALSGLDRSADMKTRVDR